MFPIWRRPTDLDALIVTVFCLVDDALTAELAGRRLRRRGPHPTLCDLEVLTMEVVFSYFRRHYGTSSHGCCARCSAIRCSSVYANNGSYCRCAWLNS